MILWSLELGGKRSNTSPMYIFENTDVVSQICFFKDKKSNRFVSGSLDCSLKVWDIRKKSNTTVERL